MEHGLGNRQSLRAKRRSSSASGWIWIVGAGAGLGAIVLLVASALPLSSCRGCKYCERNPQVAVECTKYDPLFLPFVSRMHGQERLSLCSPDKCRRRLQYHQHLLRHPRHPDALRGREGVYLGRRVLPGRRMPDPADRRMRHSPELHDCGAGLSVILNRQQLRRDSHRRNSVGAIGPLALGTAPGVRLSEGIS